MIFHVFTAQISYRVEAQHGGLRDATHGPAWSWRGAALPAAEGRIDGGAHGFHHAAGETGGTPTVIPTGSIVSIPCDNIYDITI